MTSGYSEQIQVKLTGELRIIPKNTVNARNAWQITDFDTAYGYADGGSHNSTRRPIVRSPSR